MVLGERMVGHASSWLHPDDLVGLVDLCWIDALVSQWHLVLLVVVDWSHLLDDAEENRDCILWKLCSCVPIRMLVLTVRCIREKSNCLL